MSDPPRLRDLASGDDFTRGLLRDAPATRAFTAADAVRLQASVAKAGAAATSGWFTVGAASKALLAVALVAGGGFLASRRVRVPAPRSAHVVERASAPVTAPAARSAAPSALSAAPAARSTAPAVPSGAPSTHVAASAPHVAASAPHVAAPSTHVAAPSTHVAAPSTHVAAPSAHVVASSAPVPAAAAPTLDDELRAIGAAQAALASDPARAADLLARAERVNPRPQLRDERDVLHIEALARLGRWSEARARAAALEARAPQSPQSARARSLLRASP